MPDSPVPSSPPAPVRHFLHDLIEADNASGRWGTWGAAAPDRANTPRVHTRFPPEPNGYLHIGHTKSICLNYGLAKTYNGKFNLRFDDTNPAKEEQEYVDSIKDDVKWLGADFESGPHAGGVLWASDYFEQMYLWAEDLVKKGKAYVCDLTADQVSKDRGVPTRPGKESPFRTRTVEENLDLLRRMRKGEFPNGSKTLRAKIDMTSPNLNLRDPVMYRILHEPHHNTGDKWCIYPMYDWAHGLEDSIERITHSICTLEFENHRPLYDWFLKELAIYHPQQIEFSRLNLTYTVMSKRKLLELVKNNHVSGWDDPRMPTIRGYRRRGYTAESIRAFNEEVSVTRVDSFIDVGRLENAIREDLNKRAPRTMAVLRPLKIVIENWPAGKVDLLDFVINPEDASAGTRKVPFSGTLYIEQEDFMEVPAKKYFRLAPGQEVRLRWAYFIKCVGVDKNPDGTIAQVRCTFDPATRGGDCPPGPNGEPPRKVKGTLHWVSADHTVPATVRLFDRLFTKERPDDPKDPSDYKTYLNPHSLETLTNARIENHLAETAKAGDRFQFERLGYFCVDQDTKPGALVFNRTVTLRDTWARVAEKSA